MQGHKELEELLTQELVSIISERKTSNVGLGKYCRAKAKELSKLVVLLNADRLNAEALIGESNETDV